MAYSYQVPVSYTVNVSLTQTPSGLAGYNTNSIAIFSNEQANFSENYIRALSPDTVKAAYGSNSLTYKMARALFTPVPNFRTGRGELYVFKFDGTNATAGKVTTADLTLANFKEVTNGSLKVSIDGATAIQLDNLDFTNIATVGDIAQVILNKNPDMYVFAQGDAIVFQSKRGGGSIAFSAATVTGTQVDLSGSQYFYTVGESATAVTTAGTAVSGQKLSDAVEDALQQVYFGGVLTTQYQDNTALATNAAAIESLDCVYYNELESLKNITIAGSANKLAGCSKTRLLAYSLGSEEAKVAVATYATIAQSVNFSGTDTANTLNLKSLTVVSPDSGLSDTYLLDARDNGVDVYGNTGGLACVYSNDNNGYTDDVVATLRFKKDIQVGGFNYLRQTSTKIPQTEKGMTGLKSAYALVCEKFVNNGVIAPNAWNNSIPFGDPDAFQRNIQEKGYYIYSIPVAQQQQSEREQRIAPVVQIAIKLSGAFHFSDVIINVQR